MAASDHLNRQQFRTRMPVSELLPMAEDRLSDPASRKNVEALADSFRRVGYQTRKHGGMSGDMHHYPPSQPITVIHSDSGSSLWNGNHRVHAANMAGLDTLPVLVKDYRTNGT